MSLAEPSNTRPQEIASFSYDRDRKFSLGDASLQYYYPPSLPADLNIGFDTFQKLNDAADEHLDALLDTMVALEQETQKKCDADIVTWRGMMTKARPSSTLRGKLRPATLVLNNLE